MALTQAYLHEHAKNAETYEAIGRNISALLLREAAATLQNEGRDSVDAVDLTIAVKLTQFEPLLCVKAEVCAPIVGCVTIHAGA